MLTDRLQQKYVTNANDDKGGGTVQHSQSYDVEHDPVEEVRQRKTQNNCDNAPECQPDGKRRQNEHQNDNCHDGDNCKSNVVPERSADFVVKDVISTVEHADFAVKQYATSSTSEYSERSEMLHTYIYHLTTLRITYRARH